MLSPDIYQNVADAFGRAMSAGFGPTAMLVPSTPRTMECVREAMSAHDRIVVVGSSIPGATSAHALLSQAACLAERSCVVVFFADQLIHPQVATVPVEAKGQVFYCSGVEAVLYARYGFRLMAVDAGGVDVLEGGGTIGQAIAFLCAHLSRCAQLGDAWLMRHAQSERARTVRVREARLRLRYLQSATYLLYAQTPLDDNGASAVREITCASRALGESALP